VGAISTYTPVTPAEGMVDGDYLLGNKGVGLTATRRFPPATVFDRRFGVMLERYGAVFNGTSNDQPAIQNALSAMATGNCNGPKALCTFPPGVQARILNPGLSIDVSRLAVNFNYSLLDASGMTSGRAIGVTGTQANVGPYGQQCGGLTNLHLWGHVPPASTPLANVAGIALDSATSGAGTRAEFRNLYVRGFGGGGITLANRCYLNQFFNCEIAHCGVGVRQFAATDAGESVSFFGGLIYNCSDYAVKTDNSLGQINLHGVSLDYNGGFVHCTEGATVFLRDCNLETNWSLATGNPDLCPIVCDGTGGAVVVNGGRMPFTGSNPSGYHLIHSGLTSSQCAVYLQNTWMNNWGNTFNRLAKGQGKVFPRDIILWDGGHTNMPRIIGAGGGFQNDAMNEKLSDWSFESAPIGTPATVNIWDQVFIFDDGGVLPTDLWAGVHGDIGISNLFASHGSQSLELKKKSAAGVTFIVAIIAPVKRRAAWGMECKVRGDGAVSGTYGMGFGASVFRPTPAGAVWRYGVPVDFPDLVPGTAFVTRAPTGLGYQWGDYTHYYMLFDLTTLGPGSLFVDEVLISEW
jgi:hypothetical protein